VVTSTTSPLYIGASTLTNNTAELSGATEALYLAKQWSIKHPNLREIELRYDSQYSAKMIQGSWTPKANFDLIKRAQEIYSSLPPPVKVTFTHVYGHTGSIGNERADELAKLGAAGNMAKVGRFANYVAEHSRSLLTATNSALKRKSRSSKSRKQDSNRNDSETDSNYSDSSDDIHNRPAHRPYRRSGISDLLSSIVLSPSDGSSDSIIGNVAGSTSESSRSSSSSHISTEDTCKNDEDELIGIAALLNRASGDVCSSTKSKEKVTHDRGFDLRCIDSNCPCDHHVYGPKSARDLAAHINSRNAALSTRIHGSPYSVGDVYLSWGLTRCDSDACRIERLFFGPYHLAQHHTIAHHQKLGSALNLVKAAEKKSTAYLSFHSAYHLVCRIQRPNAQRLS
jgi:ribonuclease HI